MDYLWRICANFEMCPLQQTVYIAGDMKIQGSFAKSAETAIHIRGWVWLIYMACPQIYRALYRERYRALLLNPLYIIRYRALYIWGQAIYICKIAWRGDTEGLPPDI